MPKIFAKNVAVSTGLFQAEWFKPGDVCPPQYEHLVDPNCFTIDSREQDPGPKPKYSRLNNTELQIICRDRGLDDSGSKKEMVLRLEQADAALS